MRKQCCLAVRKKLMDAQVTLHLTAFCAGSPGMPRGLHMQPAGCLFKELLHFSQRPLRCSELIVCARTIKPDQEG